MQSFWCLSLRGTQCALRCVPQILCLSLAYMSQMAHLHFLIPTQHAEVQMFDHNTTCKPWQLCVVYLYVAYIYIIWTFLKGPLKVWGVVIFFTLVYLIVNLKNICYFLILFPKARIQNFLQDAFCLSKYLEVSKAQVLSDTPAGSSAAVKGANVIVFLMFITIRGWVHSLSHNFLQIPLGRAVKYLSCLEKRKLSWLVRRRLLDSCPAIKLLSQ